MSPSHRKAALASCTIAIAALAAPAAADCPCPADLNGNSTVNGVDLEMMLSAWGPASPARPSADINQDGIVDANDLALLLDAWGECPESTVLMDPKMIQLLAREAYLWSLPLEFTYRFGIYNSLMTANVNTLDYFSEPAAWNNAATNGGNSSVLYLNGILDLSGETTLVYTVPNPSTNFTVSQFIDAFVNTFADPGSRTTPGAADPTSYLLVGPDSPYATSKTVTIGEFTFPVMACDTNRAQVLARVLAPTLVPATDPDSAYNTLLNIAYGFKLNTLEEFLANGGPVAPASYAGKVPTEGERAMAANYQNSPTNAVDFFAQVGASLQLNDLPTQTSCLGGTPISKLPSWIVPQPGATKTYYAPSAGQTAELARFAPIGISQSGFEVPCNWGDEQTQALQDGWLEGVELIAFLSTQSASAATNWWTYTNANWGTYENNTLGYIGRSVGVILGGFPSLVADGMYAEQDFEPGSTTVALDGGNVYSLTFSPWDKVTLPADSTLPPMMLNPDGSEVGFWSITVYQPGLGEAVCPCLSQASVLNTIYSQTKTSVLSVNAKANTITAMVPYGATFNASSPVLFGTAAAEYGLLPMVAYFMVAAPTVNADQSITFQISATWLQALSIGGNDPGTPIQYSGEAGDVVQLTQGTTPLTYGMVQPVSQLGSSEINAGLLQQDRDAAGCPTGTYTIWLAPSSEAALKAGAFLENWIPTPSQEYLHSIYGRDASVNSDIAPIFRIYAPQLGTEPPSILPCPECPASETVGGDQGKGPPKPALQATYRFPMLMKQSGQ